jgi:hypothetical protein
MIMPSSSFHLNLKQISCLAENTNHVVVFDEVLSVAGKDICTKDIPRIRGGWAIQDVFYVSSSQNLNICIMQEYHALETDSVTYINTLVML